MEIIIPLPRCDDSSTYKGIKGYLKQLELAVHHAQKAVDNAEEIGVEITEDTYINFTHPVLESSMLSDARDMNLEARQVLEAFADTYYDELRQIELKINIQ